MSETPKRGYHIATAQAGPGTDDAGEWQDDGPRVWPATPFQLYVVAFGTEDDLPDEGAPVFTLSHSPDCAGWETDGAHHGYGLPLATAQAIARRYNGSDVL